MTIHSSLEEPSSTAPQRPSKTPRRESVPGVARPSEPAHVIKDDAEAVAVARRLAAQFAEGAAERDRNRRWPVDELNAFSQSGLWSLNVPKEFGGPEVSYATLCRVIEI